MKFELHRTKEIVGIHFVNENDMFDNLNDIFETLKKYTNVEQEKIRKRIKQ